MAAAPQQQQEEKAKVDVPPKGALMGAGSGLREGLFGFGCGVLYGMTSPLIGHPFDTVKTKMQAQEGYRTGGMMRTFATVIKNEGFFALYKGLLPPLIGSGIFRSVQFGVYNSSWAILRDWSFGRKEIPGTGGLEVRVVAAGLVASTARTVIETPLELIKVRRQMGQAWKFNELYRGFNVTWIRTCGLMCTFFILVDSGVRHLPNLINAPYVGPFLKGGLCSTISWWLIWPFETLKSQVQGNTPGPKGIFSRLAFVAQTGGLAGLFRGIVPGSTRSLLANGCSMIVFTQCQSLRHHFIGDEQPPEGESLPHAPLDADGNAILEPPASSAE